MESRAELIITPILWHSYTAVALVCKDEVIPEQKKVVRDLVDAFLAGSLLPSRGHFINQFHVFQGSDVLGALALLLVDLLCDIIEAAGACGQGFKNTVVHCRLTKLHLQEVLGFISEE